MAVVLIGVVNFEKASIDDTQLWMMVSSKETGDVGTACLMRIFLIMMLVPGYDRRSLQRTAIPHKLYQLHLDNHVLDSK